MRIPGFASENFTGVFTTLIGPQAGWSISLTMSLARTAGCQYTSKYYIEAATYRAHGSASLAHR
jgi:hypothetical protein